jgi:hypothetical protein
MTHGVRFTGEVIYHSLILTRGPIYHWAMVGPGLNLEKAVALNFFPCLLAHGSKPVHEEKAYKIIEPNSPHTAAADFFLLFLIEIFCFQI